MAIMQTVVLINFMGVTMKTVKGIIDPKVLWMSLMDGLLDPLACSALCIRRPAFLPSLQRYRIRKCPGPNPLIGRREWLDDGAIFLVLLKEVWRLTP